MIAIAGPAGRRRPFPLLGLQSGQVDAESQLAIADAGKGLRLRAEIEPIVQPPAISDARRITGGDRRQRRVGGDHGGGRRFEPQIDGAADTDGCTVQSVGRIVGTGDVVLDVGPGENLELEPVALEPPARQYLRLLLGADHPGIVERAGAVAVQPARSQELQREALVVEPAGRPLQAAVHETAVAPQVGARKQKELRAVVAGPGRSGGHANATTTEGHGDDHRRAHASPATH